MSSAISLMRTIKCDIHPSLVFPCTNMASASGSRCLSVDHPRSAGPQAVSTDLVAPPTRSCSMITGSPQEEQCAKVTRLRCPHRHVQIILTSGIFSFFGGRERGWRPSIRSCECGSLMMSIYVSFGAMKHRTCPATMHATASPRRFSRRRTFSVGTSSHGASFTACT